MVWHWAQSFLKTACPAFGSPGCRRRYAPISATTFSRSGFRSSRTVPHAFSTAQIASRSLPSRILRRWLAFSVLRGSFFASDGVEQLPRPRLPLQEQVDRQGLEFGVQVRVLRQHDLGDAGSSDRPSAARTRARKPAEPEASTAVDGSGSAGSLKAIRASRACRRTASGWSAETNRSRTAPASTEPDPEPGGEQLRVERRAGRRDRRRGCAGRPARSRGPQLLAPRLGHLPRPVRDTAERHCLGEPGVLVREPRRRSPATGSRSASGSPRRRSTTRGRSLASAGASLRSTRSTSLTNRPPCVGQERVEVLPDDRRDELVVAAGGQHLDQDRQRLQPLDLPRGDGDLEPHVGRGVAGQRHDPVADRGRRPGDVPGGPHAPGPERRGRRAPAAGGGTPAPAAPVPTSAQSACIRALPGRRVVEDQRLAAGRRTAGVFRSVSSRWAISRK